MKLCAAEIKSLKRLLTLFLLVSAAFAANGQTDQVPPDPPALTYLTVNQSTGYTDLIWSVPNAAPDIAGFVIYHYDIQSKEGYAIDTIYDPTATTYSADDGKLTSTFVESYVVAAFDNSGNISPLSNYLSTILVESKLDSCNKKIVITWNDYLSVPYKVTGYDIFCSENGGAYILAGRVDETATSFETDGLMNGSSYSFNVRAVLENSQISSSNKTDNIAVNFRKTPAWINADYATVTGSGEIALSFTIDPDSETDLFMLERKSGQSGSYQEIAMIRTSVQSITYTDWDASPETLNYYMLSAVNSCNLKAISSNQASNIILKANSDNNEINLKWSSYRYWLGNVSSYRLFIDTGNGFNEYAEISSPDTTYSISLPDIMYSLSAGEVCFYVTADETSNPYGISGESCSNRVCYTSEEKITVPNIFTPDGDLKNDLFKPVLTFTPSDYHLIISDRQGKTVFETRDQNEYWDGTDNGRQLPQGVYIWFVKTRTYSGKTISKTGTVTIYRNRK